MATMTSTDSALAASSSKSGISGTAPSHRLLYRGALALPDSHLLLDGLSFVTDTTSSSENLLENPLALALESMRGRPSLHFLGTENLKDVWLDVTSEINVCVTRLLLMTASIGSFTRLIDTYTPIRH